MRVDQFRERDRTMRASIKMKAAIVEVFLIRQFRARDFQFYRREEEPRELCFGYREPSACHADMSSEGDCGYCLLTFLCVRKYEFKLERIRYSDGSHRASVKKHRIMRASLHSL